MNELTQKEEEFLGYLKKELFLKNYCIKKKVSLKEICDERRELDFVFGKDEELVKNILIDFMLYKKDKAVCGIEIIDEPDELSNLNGERMLKETLFRRMGYEYFRVVNLDKLKEAAKEIRSKLKSTSL